MLYPLPTMRNTPHLHSPRIHRRSLPENLPAAAHLPNLQRVPDSSISQLVLLWEMREFLGEGQGVYGKGHI